MNKLLIYTYFTFFIKALKNNSVFERSIFSFVVNKYVYEFLILASAIRWLTSNIQHASKIIML